jgi:hypothetical protein
MNFMNVKDDDLNKVVCVCVFMLTSQDWFPWLRHRCTVACFDFGTDSPTPTIYFAICSEMVNCVQIRALLRLSSIYFTFVQNISNPKRHKWIRFNFRPKIRMQLFRDINTNSRVNSADTAKGYGLDDRGSIPGSG